MANALFELKKKCVIIKNDPHLRARNNTAPRIPLVALLGRRIE